MPIMSNGRLTVAKTYKLFIGGGFPRSESGRTLAVSGADGRTIAHVCRASRKDWRNAVEAAAKAQAGWAARTAYNRGQILYRLAEMLEARRAEFVDRLREAPAPPAPDDAAREVDAAVDRLVRFAGWTDKFGQIMGSHNPVAGPYYDFTVPEPTGTIAVVCPDEPPLLALVGLLAPVLAVGNVAVVLASETRPLAAAVFAEVCATSDVPPGVVNLLTGLRSELLEQIASHRNVDGIHAADLEPEEARTLREGMVENVKRVQVRRVGPRRWFEPETTASPWWMEPFVEMKTIWHPSGV